MSYFAPKRPIHCNKNELHRENVAGLCHLRDRVASDVPSGEGTLGRRQSKVRPWTFATPKGSTVKFRGSLQTVPRPRGPSPNATLRSWYTRTPGIENRFTSATRVSEFGFDIIATVSCGGQLGTATLAGAKRRTPRTKDRLCGPRCCRSETAHNGMTGTSSPLFRGLHIGRGRHSCAIATNIPGQPSVSPSATQASPTYVHA